MGPEMSSTDIMFAEELPAASHARNINVAVPMRSRRNLSTMVKSAEKGRLNTATESTTVVVKKENEFDVSEVVGSSHPSREMLDAQGALLQAIRTVYCVYAENFQSLHETH